MRNLKELAVIIIFLFLLLLYFAHIHICEAKTVIIRYTVSTTKTPSSALSSISSATREKSSGQGSAHGAPIIKSESSTVSMSLSIEQKIRRAFSKLGNDVADTAVAVAHCESGLRPNAIGDTALAYYVNGAEYGKSYGVFQIRHLPGRPDPDKLLDPDFNINYAVALFQRSGFQPWSAYTNDCYKSFLAQGGDTR